MPFGSFFRLGGHLEVSYASSPSEGLRVKVQLEQPDNAELTRGCARRRTLQFGSAGFSSLPTEMLEFIVKACFASWSKATRVLRVNKDLCEIGRVERDDNLTAWWSGDGSPMTPLLSGFDQTEEIRTKMWARGLFRSQRSRNFCVMSGISRPQKTSQKWEFPLLPFPPSLPQNIKSGNSHSETGKSPALIHMQRTAANRDVCGQLAEHQLP